MTGRSPFSCRDEDLSNLMGTRWHIVSVLLPLSRMVTVVLESVVEVSVTLILTLAPYDCYVMARSIKVSKR